MTPPPNAPGLAMQAYRHEQGLFFVLAAFSILFWLGITLLTIGIVWIYVLMFWIIGLFSFSALISHLKGSAVRITPEQFPDLHARLLYCCQRVGLTKVPEAYVMNGDGLLNAFATRFLRRYYVVLLSDVLGAIDSDKDAINFYIGHEIGHVHRSHIANGWWLAPSMWMPVIGAAYRRAQEYTCDQYGLVCCQHPESAAHALAVLAAGPSQWKAMNLDAYLKQCETTGGFWMSLNELTSDYPWLCKRMRHIMPQSPVTIPSRNPFAWFLSLFMFRAGPLGIGGSMLFLVAFIGVLAAIAIPQYQDYVTRAKNIQVFSYAGDATTKVGQFYMEKEQLPESLEAIGITPKTTGLPIKAMELSQDGGQITIELASGHSIVYEPHVDDAGKVVWDCATDLPKKQIPKNAKCQSNYTDPNDISDLIRQMR